MCKVTSQWRFCNHHCSNHCCNTVTQARPNPSGKVADQHGCSGTCLQVATAVAEANWVPTLQHLLSQAPVTTEDKQLWLELLPLVGTLVGYHAAQPTGLQLLAVSLRQPALLVLGRGQGAQGPPSLPLALTNHSDATLMFSEAQKQLTSIAVTQVSCSMRVTLCQHHSNCVCGWVGLCMRVCMCGTGHLSATYTCTEYCCCAHLVVCV